MNTNALKRFAKDARIKLLLQVAQKLEFVLTHDTAELRGKEKEITQLKNKIQQAGKEQVIEMVAYTWFNRLMALRFMDANGYTLPKVVTPLPGMTNPEILQNALGGNIEPGLNLERQRLNDLLDGKTAAADAHTEAYKMLLVASCNQWYPAMPFMFERISDYTELLLPDDLLSDFSIVADIRNGMSEEDCKQEELIGWLYQFYISDKKDVVFEGLKKNIKITAENIPAATQLFTPRWIVRYMVENTLGKLWLTLKPDSKLRQHMPYYIEAPDGNTPPPLPEGIKGVTDITFLDPCQGSGHILVYTFELFTKIYEEEGYNTNEIPSLILHHNLFGIDIDERAAQLAAFALTMKARSYYSRFLRKPIQPHVIALENVSEETILQAVKLPISVKSKKVTTHKDLSLYLLLQADNFGSLVKIESEEVAAIQIQQGSIWQDQQQSLKVQAEYLSRHYHCVITNPPYMSSTGANDKLRKFLEKNYPISKADLMTCFMERSMSLGALNGFWAMINLPSWMFLSTFEEFRKRIIREHTINSMLHLGRGIFGSDFGSVVFAIQIKTPQIDNTGVYRRLFNEHVQVRSVEVIKQLFFSDKYGYFEANQKDFGAIPGSPLGYWLTRKMLNVFIRGKVLNQFASIRQGMATSDNNRFLRFWNEVSYNRCGFKIESREEALLSNKKWFPYNKGGAFRKWYGNAEYVVNWGNDGEEIKKFREFKNSTLSSNMGVAGLPFIFKKNITWSKVTAGKFSVRYLDNGFLFDVSGCSIYEDSLLIKLLGLLNSKVLTKLISEISPTVNYEVGHIKSLPIVSLKFNLEDIITENLKIAREDWNSKETSWDFCANNLIIQKVGSIKTAFNLYKSYWEENFKILHKNEEQLNREFISLYELEDELTPEVNLDEITILNEESKIVNDKLYIDPAPVLLQLLSYSTGCFFGRYSFNKPSLILANQGETIQHFLKQLPNPTFMPDEDNIIPVLDGEWFADDIVGRFKVFLKGAFGGEHFDENLKYIEDTIGKDIRKYFVKDFYNDHIKRYKKRPIYWMFSSRQGHFKALIYMHRYQPDLCSKLLNDYLQNFIGKLDTKKQSETRLTLREDISAREKVLANKEIDKLEVMLKDCREYEKTLFSVATQKISIDLDDGVKVNYQKFKDVLVPIKGLEQEEE